jgi:EmrB/QacA subfamily drug resistance transporter
VTAESDVVVPDSASAVARPRAAPPRQRRAPSSTAVLVIAAFGAFLAFLDSTIVNVAFPSIRASFPHSSISTMSWVLNAYNIVFGAFLVASGRIADLLGRRRVFVIGIALFTVSSVACAVAASPLQLIVFRIAQGLGAALLVPASLAVVVEAFPAARVTHAVTLWGAAAAVAAGLGPPIGGALVTSSSWRLAFLVNLPVGVTAWVLARRGLVESRAPGRRQVPDLRGAILLAAGLSLLTLGLVKGQDWGWSSALVVGSFCAGIALLVGFTASNRVHPSPILDPHLLRQRRFSVATVLLLVAGAGFYAYTLNHILWLHYVWHYSLFEAGLAVSPGAIVAAVMSRPFGGLAQRRGYRPVIVGGAVVWAVALGLLYARRIGVSPDFLGAWLPAQIVSGIGVGAVLPLLTSSAVSGVPGGGFATASAAAAAARQLGAVVGIAILVVIFGTHEGPALVHALRQGWDFSAICFVVVAVGALVLGRDSDHGSAPMVEGAEDLEVTSVDGDRAPIVDDSEDPASVDHESILSDVPADALVPVDVRAGDWLFHAGDVGDAMYIVVRGKLEVHVGDHVVARLGPGSVVGELALLTGEPRNASIRARRDSRLMKLDKDRFAEVARREPKVPLAVARTLAQRLQRVEAPALGVGPARVLAVVGTDSEVPLADVSAALTAELGIHLRTVDPGRVNADGLERAEERFDRVILTAPYEDQQWRDFCVRAADRVIVVASPNSPPTSSAIGLPLGSDLVMAGTPQRSAVPEWYDALAPTSMHVLDPGETVAHSLRPLVARLLGRSVGLVLSGGGARAMCHLGVIAVLEEAGVHVDRIAGTSAGALLGALYAAGYDAEELDAAIYEEFVRHNPHGDYTFPRYGLIRGQKTQAGLIRHFGDLLIEELPREFRCASVDLVRRELIIHRRGLVMDAVMASLRLPGLYSPYRIGDVLHVDGGVMDNVPVDALTGAPEGLIVAVGVNLGTTSPGGQTDLLGIRDTLMRAMLVSSHQAAEQSLARADVVIRPRADSVGLLEWHQIDVVREAGRQAALRALPKIKQLLWGTEGTGEAFADVDSSADRA